VFQGFHRDSAQFAPLCSHFPPSTRKLNQGVQSLRGWRGCAPHHGIQFRLLNACIAMHFLSRHGMAYTSLVCSFPPHLPISPIFFHPSSFSVPPPTYPVFFLVSLYHAWHFQNYCNACICRCCILSNAWCHFCQPFGLKVHTACAEGFLQTNSVKAYFHDG
jgi:hypothetical protein